MNLKSKLISTLALLGVISCSSVYATEVTSIFSGETITRENIQTMATATELNGDTVLGILMERESGNVYGWDPIVDEYNDVIIDGTGNPQMNKVWKIVNYPSESSTDADYSKLYYCLNAMIGFEHTEDGMTNGAKDIYSDYYDMNNSADKELIKNYAGGSLGTNYNKVLWILNNSYVPTGNSSYKTSAEYKRLMKAANISILNDQSDLTEEQVDVVQQLALWYFTNQGEGFIEENLPSIWMRDEEDGSYYQLSSVYYGTDKYGAQIRGSVIQNKMNTLYKYFIQNAELSTDATGELTLELSNENVVVTETEDNYIVGPFSLNVEGNKELIKNITATVNVDYTLLNSNQSSITGNDFSKVIGSDFYLRINKSKINESTDISIDLEYIYDKKDLTVMTDVEQIENTQAVVLVETQEINKNTDTNAKIELTQVSIEKIWDDNNNQDNSRAEYGVTLKANGEEYREEVRLNANETTYTWDKLLKYKNGVEVVYTVEETWVPSGYTVSYSADTFTITNKYAPETTSVSGTKTWNDRNDQDGKRPEEITVNLLANGTEVKETTVTAETDWKYNFTDLPKYEDGKEIKYTISEDKVDGYTTSISGYNITNAYTPQTIEKTVTKVWDDNNNIDRKRPTSIIINLLENGTKIKDATVTSTNSWKYTFKNLPKYKNGQEIVYTVEEATVPSGYTVSYSESEDTFTITNTYEPQITEKTVTKVWDDNNNQDGKRAEYGVTLKADGKAYGEEIKLDKDTTTHTWENLPKYKDGREIVYTVEETTVPSGYTVEYSEDTFTITNKYIPEKITKTVRKVWNDNNNQDGKRAEYGITLKANGETCGEEVILDENTTTFTWKNLPKYENGEEIEYTVEETTVPSGYTVEYSEDTFTITNTYTPEKITKTVIKVWVDNDNQDGKRAEYGVILKANGKAYGEEIKLDKDTTTHTWENLPKYENGREIEYTVEETTVPSEYTVSYSEDTFTITNTYTPGKIEKTVRKVWDDNNNQDGKRAEYGITLKANGEACGEEVILDENTTTFTWKNLPKYENGEEIEYTVEETTVPSGYTVEYSEDTFTITNTYTPEKITKTVTKIWVDNDNQDGSRAEYGVTLKANGEACGEEVILDENTTTFTWKNLPKYENGEEIEYTVEETTVPSGYTVEYSEDTFTITNTYTPGKISKKVIKQWNDQDDRDELRPTDIIVKLYKTVDGHKEEIETKRLNEANNWMYEWNNLDEKQDGKTIIYSVEENEIQGYTTTYSHENFSNTDEIIITNTHVPEEITGKYNVILRKVDENGNILKGSKFKINDIEYNLLNNGEVKLAENIEILSTENIKLRYSIKETVVPNRYVGIEDAILNISATVIKNDNNNYVITRVTPTFEGTDGVNHNISVILAGNTIVISVKNTPIEEPPVEEKEFDLALRKFITKVNDVEYSRTPIVDTSKLGTTVDGKVVTTATYKHTKQPIAVQKGDIVTYTIRVYNEGELDGYVDKITDYVSDGLLPIIVGTEGIDEEKYAEEIEFNLAWGWLLSEDGKSVTTIKTSKEKSDTYSMLEGYESVTDTKLDAYVEGSSKLDYIDVQIKCLVTDSAVKGEYLTNIAEITDAQDINNKKWDGKDSVLANANIENLSNYKNTEALASTEQSYIPGQEDDDDFEKLVVKEFDLALRKFITKVNDVMYATRTPIVDASKLGTTVNGKVMTTATYTHSKQPIIVETNDIVTYTIRIFNEGTIAGYANEITDNIPEGLEFLPNSEINKQYGWKMLDKDGKETQDITKAVIITTDYLSDKDVKNIIRKVEEVDGVKTLDYKDVEVQFKVIAKAENLKDNIIINEAQISADSDRDIDSEPNRDEKYDYTNKNNEDDIDYEPIKLQYFDLALRKFITKVNSTDYNNRYPEIEYNEEGSITYNHTKDPVLVTTGDVVTYTIRVYNEGEKAGYATEIKDNLPIGLAFDPENETNQLYKWKMLDAEGNETTDASKVVSFSTDYLKDELIRAFIKENGSNVLDYKDVQIAFIVTEQDTSDRILVNTAQISSDSGDDIDSTPDNNIESEDDLDKEYVRVEYFDLALKKWVTATKVTLDGETTITDTEFNEDSEEIAKVDIVASKLKKTTVKFVYNIKVTNEGQLPGYVYEVKDYIPSGLKFIAEDNEGWTEEDGIAVTDQLKDTLLNPGESALVEIVLTWKNSSTNLGLKTNYAEISEDSADDIDSTPDNYDFTEDDMDDAQVILSIKTAGAKTYVGLILISVLILAGGTFLIKKYVID